MGISRLEAGGRHISHNIWDTGTNREEVKYCGVCHTYRRSGMGHNNSHFRNHRDDFPQNTQLSGRNLSYYSRLDSHLRVHY